MFGKILIANRGEIACRIIATARRLGITTVAVYAEADRNGRHVRLADEAYCIGPSPAARSYLDVEAILRVCIDTGVEAVHPGYGFLSENTAFAQALASAGITFIGPPPEAISAMGDKLTSKQIATAAGVATIPGHDGIIADGDQATAVARAIGYPVMLKASAGGGGKGMRVVHDDDQCREGFLRARSEAAAAFGDDRILLEKYIEEPRHIEAQIIADNHGNVFFLGERECSLQRRHQKVIEESPSPFLDDATRRAMGDQAMALARAVGYRSAGTVEFIVDNEKNCYFLEMNTRLQVEHPVTELVTGLDLVELMLRVAAGEELRLRQEELVPRGWAVEARLYAEDPARNFLPSAGRLTTYRPPAGDGLRLDSGYDEGDEVPVFYDPMLAKLVAHGASRHEALDRLATALDGFSVQGVTTNLDFLARLCRHPRFRDGAFSTNFIAEHFPDGYRPESGIPDHATTLIVVAAAVHHRYMSRAAAISGQLPGLERRVAGQWIVCLAGEHHPVEVTSIHHGHQVTYRDRSFTVSGRWALGDTVLHLLVNRTPCTCRLQRDGLDYVLAHGGCRARIRVLSPRAAELSRYMLAKPETRTANQLVSPMPGQLLEVLVRPGQKVAAGEPLAVVEAMKMENVLRAERDSTVTRIVAQAGDTLAVDQVILEFA